MRIKQDQVLYFGILVFFSVMKALLLALLFAAVLDVSIWEWFWLFYALAFTVNMFWHFKHKSETDED
jgi:hypothetical protein